MKHWRAGQAASAQQAPLISLTTWGDFADKMRGRVDEDMSDGEGSFTLADYSAPTEPDHSAFWEYRDDHIDELPTNKSQLIENYSTVPMSAL